MRKYFLVILLLISLGFSAPKIVLKNLWIQPTPPGIKTTMMGGVILNEGDEEDYLIGARSEVAKAVEIHKTVMENQIAKMVKQDRVKIPPKGKVHFKHHGYHIMLIGLKRPLKEGDKVKVTLIFENSGEITVVVPVKMHMMMEHHH